MEWVPKGAYVMPILPESLRIDPILASLLHLALFLELSDDDTVDLDWAVEAVEHMGHYLQSLSPQDARRIQKQLDRVADHLGKNKQPEDAIEFVSDFLRSSGIDV